MTAEFVLITRDECAYCEAAKKIINNNNDYYAEVIIDKDITRDEVLKKYPNMKMLPIVVKDNLVIGNLIELMDYYNQQRQNAPQQAASNALLSVLVSNSKGVRVTFEKKDGTVREMVATLNPLLIPQKEDVSISSTGDVVNNKNPDRKTNPNIQIVYDLEKQSWRSFRKDSVISYGEVN